MKKVLKGCCIVILLTSIFFIKLERYLEFTSTWKDKNFYGNIKNDSGLSSNNIGVYSWDINDLINDTVTVSNICSNLGINEIFQEIPEGYFNNDLTKAINNLRNNSKEIIEISYLCGDASWYNNADYAKEEIDRLIAYNINYCNDFPISKIVFDIEPWTLGISNWADEFLNTIKEIYDYGKKNNITCILTIPFWLDTSEEINNTDIYKGIIENSHGVIVMNYNRYAYFEGMDNEVSHAKERGKIIYSAAETQKPNERYGVYDFTTYYNIGLDKLVDDWEGLRYKYKYSGLGFAYHDLNSLKLLNTM